MLRVCWTMGALETIAGRMFASMLVPAVLGADPLVQLIHVDDVVDAARLAAHAVWDGTFNVAGDGVLPLSTVIKLVGRLRAAAPESAVRAALDALWVAGIGNVPGAHTTYLRDTFVARVDELQLLIDGAQLEEFTLTTDDGSSITNIARELLSRARWLP